MVVLITATSLVFVVLLTGLLSLLVLDEEVDATLVDAESRVPSSEFEV